MRPILVIGAGGWGREALVQMQGDPAHGKDWIVTGVLDDRPHLLDGLGYDVAIVGDPLTYEPRPGEAFVCAIGTPRERRKYSQPLRDRGAEFINILTDLHRSPRAHLGTGCLFSPRVQLSPEVRIGDFVNIHTLTVVGHDVEIGDYAQIGAMVFIGGGAVIGAEAVVHPHATILPGIRVGEGAVVGAGAVVVKDVAAGVTVFGNPARPIF